MVELNQTGPRDYLQGFGGDASNFAIAAARQGARVGFLGALGEDRYGRMVRELWDAEGVDHAHVAADPEGYTALYIVTHGSKGHEFSFFRAGSAAARMTPARLDCAALARTRALHLTGVSLAISPSACDAGYAAIEAARAAGALISSTPTFA